MKEKLLYFNAVFIFTFLTINSNTFSWSQQKTSSPDNYISNENKDRKELLIPNAFSPNGDGVNDYFNVANITEEKIIDFRVFNRWGTIMFRTNDSLTKGWNGQYKGIEQPIGQYGYVITIAFADGNISTYKGTIFLIK